ncbi:uncharacterized protein LOC129597696 [Paramacrobiotus metropolitanus]|uniref:uncharacterized protein LOC129597696 n=1 Tax=Paramacrobiotus metropolitanus TaxID=2943436 RepID=UPI002445CAD1|nr:uncharacterized protein LOC129597696 [Paramacrobiotus metropolitanus]
MHGDKMVDEATKKTLSQIPLLMTNAGPREKDLWPQRMKEESLSLIKYVENNKAADNDWFRLESNKEGTKWFGKCWYIHQLLKYEFEIEFDIPVTYPGTAPEIAIPELDGKTAKMYRGGKICLTDHFKPLWAKNVPKFGIAHALALGLGPWLAVEVPELIERQVIKNKEGGDDGLSGMQRKSAELCSMDSFSGGYSATSDDLLVKTNSDDQDLKDVFIGRNRLIGWLYYPFFEIAVKGCFVRLSYSKSDIATYCDNIRDEEKETELTYKIGKILSVVETRSPYSFFLYIRTKIPDQPKPIQKPVMHFTSVYLQVEMPNGEQEKLPLRNVSSVAPKDSELQLCGMPWPSSSVLKKKAADLQMWKSYRVTKDDVEHKDKYIEKLDQGSARWVSLPEMKSDLMKLKKDAMAAGDQKAAERFQHEFDVFNNVCIG